MRAAHVFDTAMHENTISRGLRKFRGVLLKLLVSFPNDSAPYLSLSLSLHLSLSNTRFIDMQPREE